MSIRFKTIRVQADSRNIEGVRTSQLPQAVDQAVNEFLAGIGDAEYLGHQQTLVPGVTEVAVITLVYKSDKPVEAPRRGRPPAK